MGYKREEGSLGQQDRERQPTILVCEVHQRGDTVLRVDVRDVARQWYADGYGMGDATV